MAKATPISADDLLPRSARSLSSSVPRGSISSADLVPLQFRMAPDFVRAFKQAALDRDLKLNELLKECFQQFMKTS
jgi:hypothetical protein